MPRFRCEVDWGPLKFHPNTLPPLGFKQSAVCLKNARASVSLAPLIAQSESKSSNPRSLANNDNSNQEQEQDQEERF